MHITNLYPHEAHPTYGIFIKEQIDSLSRIGVENQVLFINAMYQGKSAYFRAISQIRDMVKDFDIVHCHHSFCGFIALRLARVKKPVVTSFLNIVGGESKSPLLERWINKSVINGSAAFILKHDYEVSQRYPGKGFYVPNGVDIETFKPFNDQEAFERLGIPAKPYVLFVSSGSRDRPQKRYDIFRKVLDLLNTEYGYDLQELLLIKTERHLVPYYFNAAKLHLLTSEFEGSPNSVKESLACNKPVVSTDVGNVKHMISDIEGCALSDNLEVKNLAALVDKVLKFNGSFNGRSAIIEKNLDMESAARTIKDIYSRVLSN